MESGGGVHTPDRGRKIIYSIPLEQQQEAIMNGNLENKTYTQGARTTKLLVTRQRSLPAQHKLGGH